MRALNLSLGLAIYAAAAFAGHPSDRWVAPGPAYQWTEVAPEEIREIVARIEEREPGRSDLPASFDSPAAIWAKSWIDRIDEALRKRFPEETKRVPRPRILHSMNTVMNAYAIPAYRCEKLAARQPTPASGAAFGADRPRVALVSTRVVERAESEAPKTCHELKGIAEEVAFAMYFNTLYRNCALKREGTEWVFSGAACEFDPRLGARVSEIVYRAESNWIVVNHGLFKEIDASLGSARGEAAAVAFLAHELAHYYRAHHLRLGDFGFFYELDAFERTGSLTEVPPPGRIIVGLEPSELFWGTMKEKRLGHYTVEQEADDIGLALQGLLGLSPAGSLAMYAATIEYFERLFALNLRGLEKWLGTSLYECKELANPELKKAPAWVPLGTIQDHHSPCYRAFNLRRELAIHKVPFETLRVTAAPTELWSAAVRAAKK